MCLAWQFNVSTELANRQQDLAELDSGRQYEITMASTKFQQMIARGQLSLQQARYALDVMIAQGASEDDAIAAASRGGV